MNTFKKVTLGMVLGTLALAFSMPVRTVEVLGVDLKAAKAEVGMFIATELREQMHKALAEPHPVRVRQSPTVSVYEPIESILVVASRLPAEEPIETVVVAATRLPIETIVVAASRLPALDSPVVASIAHAVRF